MGYNDDLAMGSSVRTFSKSEKISAPTWYEVARDKDVILYDAALVGYKHKGGRRFSKRINEEILVTIPNFHPLREFGVNRDIKYELIVDVIAKREKRQRSTPRTPYRSTLYKTIPANHVVLFQIEGSGEILGDEERVEISRGLYNLGPAVHTLPPRVFSYFDKGMNENELNAFREIFKQNLQDFPNVDSFLKRVWGERKRLLENILQDLDEYYEIAISDISSASIKGPSNICRKVEPPQPKRRYSFQQIHPSYRNL